MVSRVTNSTVNRMYNRNYSNNLRSMTDLMNKISAQRKFTRASENPISAARALAVRKSMADVETYQSNLSSIKQFFRTAESVLREDVNDVCKNVLTKVEMACNDPSANVEERKILAHELRGIADDLIKTMNGDYADRRMFGGTNNSEGVLPFTTTKDGDRTIVLYNGEDVNKLDNPKDFPYSKPIYSDIGIGIKYDADGNVDPDTAMDISLNGAELTGCGESVYESAGGNPYTFSNNFIQMIYDAADAAEACDVDKMNAMLDALHVNQSTILTGITGLGVKQETVDYNITRFEEYNYNLSEAQLNLEGMSEEDLAKAITEWNSLDASYNAVLSMSSKVIPNSIWDFM